MPRVYIQSYCHNLVVTEPLAVDVGKARLRASARYSTYFWRQGDGILDMAGLLGKLDRQLEEWPQYIERLEHFFKANGIVGATKRRAKLLAVIGPAPFKLLSSLLSPERPNDKNIAELTEVLGQYYCPPPSEIMSQFWFNSKTRSAGESVATNVAELRRLAEFCNFLATLNKMI